MDMKSEAAKCEAMLQYTKGISNRQEIKTRVCGADAPYECHECGKALCGTHATAHSDGNLYCTNHGPDESLRDIDGMILIEPPE